MNPAPQELGPKPPRHRVDPRARKWWTVQALITTMVTLGAQLVALSVLDDSPDIAWWLRLTAASTAVLGIGYVLVMPQWRYRVHRWEADEQAVYALAGWLRIEWRVAPISRIQTIDTERTALARLFGLATLTVTTASAAGPVQIQGLDAEAADELARRLTAITQAHYGDAT